MDNYLTPEVIAAIVAFFVGLLAYATGAIIRKAVAAARASETKLDDFIVDAAEKAIEKAQRK